MPTDGTVPTKIFDTDIKVAGRAFYSTVLQWSADGRFIYFIREAEGRSNVAIARHLTITEGATEKHISSIFGKLELPQSEDAHRRVLAVLTYLNS